MQSARSSLRSNGADPAAGFTLIEVLVTLVISTIVLGAVIQFLLTNARYRREAETRIEAQQGLRSALDAVVRDIRLAGACMQRNMTSLRPVAGTNSGTNDTVSLRIGTLVNQACSARGTTSIAAAQGATTLTIDTTAGFVANGRAWVLHTDGSGEWATVRTVTSATVLTLMTGLSKAYPINSGVFGVQQRAYAIGASVAGTPWLTVSIDGATAQPIALWVNTLDVSYRLRRNCGANSNATCDTIALPTTQAEWKLVTDVVVTMTARAPSAARPGQFYTLSETIRVKPRNLLPNE
jgi:prepilin-type N-terminal cleavage/methylation domain-containing protein